MQTREVFMATKRKSKRARKPKEIRDYDEVDSVEMIDKSKALRFKDLGLALPKTPPTQVVSIRLPSSLLNELRAISSQRDIPYQALVRLWLAEAVNQIKRKEAA